jgi:hypothetical protein
MRMHIQAHSVLGPACLPICEIQQVSLAAQFTFDSTVRPPTIPSIGSENLRVFQIEQVELFRNDFRRNIKNAPVENLAIGKYLAVVMVSTFVVWLRDSELAFIYWFCPAG